MTGRRLVLLRHGQTSWNAIGRAQGHTDTELDELGHRQSSLAAPLVAAYQPVALWSSDLTRARQTTEYLAKECGLEPVYDARLREFDVGERTGLTMAEFADRFPDEHAAFREGTFRAVPGGESVADVAIRTSEVLAELLAGLAPGECAVIVSHGAALKVALTTLLGWPAEAGAALHGLDNCGWVVLDEVADGGRFRLTAYNLSA